MNYNKLIDHTLLKADAKEKDIIKLCEEAKEFDFMSVCVNPMYVPLAKKHLAGSDVKVCTVIGFPLGMNRTKIKVQEAKMAIKDGADEVDMVINIGALKARKNKYVEKEIALVKKAVGSHILKVIIETCLLNDKEKVRACQLAKSAGADFVKTSTGFSTGGATVSDVRLMRETVGEDMGVKASGGVKTYQDLLDMVAEGANRIGTSRGVDLLKK